MSFTTVTKNRKVCKVVANLRLLSCVAVILNANPYVTRLIANTIFILKKTITAIYGNKNKNQEQSKDQRKELPGIRRRLTRSNTVNYISLFSVIYNTLYFIYPDKYIRYLDYAIPYLLLWITKVHSFQFSNSAVILFNKQTNNMLLNVTRNLIVSGMLYLNSAKFSQGFAKSSKKLQQFYLQNSGKVARVKQLLLPQILQNNWEVTKAAAVVPVAVMSLTMHRGLLQLIFSMASAVNLLEKIKFSQLKEKLLWSKDNNGRRTAISLVSVAFITNFAINNSSFYPRAVVDYSLRAIISHMYQKLSSVIRESKSPSTNKNTKIFKKFQSALIALVLVNLVKFVSNVDIASVNWHKYPVSKWQFKLLKLIKEGAFPMFMDEESLSNAENDEGEHEKEQESNLMESAELIYLNDTLPGKEQTERKKSEPKVNGMPIKVYDNDYSLQIIK